MNPDLIQLLKKGDQQAFRQLMETHGQKVHNTALGMLQDAALAEDITQEVFVTVYKSILTFNEKSSLSTWIYRITVNKCLDELRSRKRKKRSASLFGLFGEPELDDPAFSNFVHPGVQSENREKAQILFRAVRSLPENQQTVFVLVHVEGLQQKEIAEIMNMSVKGVESLLQRAKTALRKKLEHLRP